MLLRLLLALLLPLRLLAQDYTPPVQWEGYAGRQDLRPVLFAAPVRGKPAAVATLPFRREAAITRRVQEATVAKVKTSNPAAAEQLARMMSENDLLAAWTLALQQFHLEADNVADALTANWLVLYLAANQQEAAPPAAQVAALRRQALRVCALPAMRTLLATDAKRQELADYLHLQSLLINEAQSTAEQAHDAPARAALAQQARQTGRQNMGFDPTTVLLTAKGFAARR